MTPAQLCRSLVAIAIVTLGATAPSDARAGKDKCQVTVKKGDTVSRIARRAGVSEANLVRANPSLKKNPNRLRVGQTLEICKAKRIESRKPQKCDGGGKIVTHTVVKGQTLGGIAAHYAVSRKSLRRYNKKLAKRGGSMIRTGERLRVCTKLRRYTHRSWFHGGVQLPEGDGYTVRRPQNAWGTAATVDSILGALASYRDYEPDAPLVQIGDISRENGGPLREHVSHQEGRDVDIGYVYDEPIDDEERRGPMNLERTWSLVRTFARADHVSVVFMDYRVQKHLYEYARSVGEDPAFLDALFEYPRQDDDAVFYHWPGHDHHFHVRFEHVRGRDPDDDEPDDEPDDESDDDAPTS